MKRLAFAFAISSLLAAGAARADSEAHELFEKKCAICHGKDGHATPMGQKMGAKEFTTEEIVDVFKGAGSRLELAKDTDNKVGQMFKAVSFPTMVVVNKDGKIEHVNIGAQADLDKSLKGQLDGLIAGKAPGGTPGGN